METPREDSSHIVLNRRKVLRAAATTAAAAAVASAGGLGGSATAWAATAPVANARPDFGVRARPFRLDAVRLTDSRFLGSQQRRLTYLRFLDMDRLLYNYRATAKLSTRGAAPCGGWESPTWSWRGHMAGHYLSGASMAVAGAGDSTLRANVDYLVAELAKCQAAATSAGYRTGYLAGFPEEYFARMEAGQFYVVFYTTHKLMAGLLDAHRLVGNDQALTVLLALADWVDWWTGQRSYAQLQRNLDTEFGGMNEVLANLYQLTGDARWLTVAKRFDHARVFDPLAAGRDELNYFHANTQMAKLMGAVKEYQATGDSRYYDIARNYWDIVIAHYTYCTGGNSSGELFRGPDQISVQLANTSCEVCNVYNMLKISRELFFLNPDRADYMDYYEWALYNEILPQQDPNSSHGRVTYYLDNRPGAAKVYDDDYGTFWCDTGSSLETYAKLNDSIYFTDGSRTLYVNLFIPSVLTWQATGLTVTQATSYPSGNATTLTVGGSGQATIRVRIPKWAAGATLTVNGAGQPAVPGSYAALNRTWANGDRIVLTMPMRVTLTPTVDSPVIQSVSYGPVLLAGQYGAYNQGSGDPGSPPAPSPMALQQFPELDPASIAATGTALVFSARADNAAVTLRPYFDTHNQYGTVYWRNATKSAHLRLRNRNSGLVIGVRDASGADGAAAVQWADNGTPDHDWEFVPAAGYVRIRNRNSGKVLGVTGAATADGASVVQWSDNGTPDHDWKVVDVAGGWVKLVNRNSGKVLGVGNASTAAGAALLQWSDNGTDDHLWQLVPVGTVRLRNVGSGLILGVQGGSGADGAAALQWHDSGTPDHGWNFVPDAGNAFRIRNIGSGRVLGIRDASTAAGAAALQWSDNGTRDHLWRLLPTGDGDTFRLLNVNSNLVLGVGNGSTAAGATCQQVADNGAADRLWKLR